MDDVFLPIIIVGMLFIGLPWIIFHYVSKWKSATTLTTEDENLLDELHELARRLDDRMCTIERIVQDENPNWREVCEPAREEPVRPRLSRENPLESRLATREEEALVPTARTNRPSRRKS